MSKEGAEDIIAFQAGREAAMDGKPCDMRRSDDWRRGWYQVAVGDKVVTYQHPDESTDDKSLLAS